MKRTQIKPAEFARILKAARERHQCTIEGWAEHVDLSDHTIGRVENPNKISNVSLDSILSITSKLGIALIIELPDDLEDLL